MADTPKVRFKGFTDAWEQRKLGKITNVLSASRVHKDEWQTDGVPFFRSSDVVSAFKGQTNEKAFISYELYEELVKSSGKLREGDLLLTGGGSIGIPYIVPNNEPLYSKDADLIWIKESSGFNSMYLYTYFTCPRFRNYISSISHIGTIAHYTIEQVKDTPIMIPSVKEQAKIGVFFNSIDQLITLHQRKCDETRELKKYMLRKMFPQKGKKIPEIRFAGFTGDWKQRKLGHVGGTYTGLSGKSKDDFGHGSGKFITYMNVFSNTVSSSDMTEAVEIDDRQNKVLFGDVLFTTSSETPEEVGMSSVWLENAENIYLNSFCFGYRPRIEFNPYYLAYMLRSSSMRKKITFLAQGISRYNISKNKMMEIEIPIPQIEEQKKIGDFFYHLDHLITLHQCKCDKLKEVKKFMLQNMFPQKG